MSTMKLHDGPHTTIYLAMGRARKPSLQDNHYQILEGQKINSQCWAKIAGFNPKVTTKVSEETGKQSSSSESFILEFLAEEITNRILYRLIRRALNC